MFRLRYISRVKVFRSLVSLVTESTIYRVADRMVTDGMLDRAAALTTYALFSFFPALLIGVSLLSLIGGAGLPTDAADYLIDRGVPAQTAQSVSEAVAGAMQVRGSVTTVTLIISFPLLAYGASSVLAGAGRALDDMAKVKNGINFLHRRLRALLVTAAALIMGVATVIIVFLGGRIADEIFSVIGLGQEARELWSLLRWPLAMVIVGALIAMIYRVTPTKATKHIWSGAVLATLLWLVASVVFFFLVDHFLNFSVTYGLFASAVILLTWLYLTNLAMLLGAEMNLYLDRREGNGSAS